MKILGINVNAAILQIWRKMLQRRLAIPVRYVRR